MSTISRLPEYETKLFCEIYEDDEDFIEDYHDIGLPVTISDTTATTLFYLLYSRYANNPIANWDETQFKYKLFSIIWQYGPTWEKRLDIQKKLRELSDDDIIRGSKAIYNHSYNPSTAPSTGTLEELTTINEQNTTNYKRSKLEAYGQLWELLDTDVTSEFLGKFIVLFKKFVRPANPVLYITEDEE